MFNTTFKTLLLLLLPCLVFGQASAPQMAAPSLSAASKPAPAPPQAAAPAAAAPRVAQAVPGSPAPAAAGVPSAAALAQAAPASAAPAAQPNDPQSQQMIIAYNYAYSLYEARKFDQAKDLFRKLAAASMQPIINGNALYYYSQCAFRTGDYDGAVKGLDLLVKRWPNSPASKKGFVTRFATFLIDQVSTLQTNWDYYRYSDGTLDEKGEIAWKESVPAGYKIKRINFKLGFGLYKILQLIEPTANETGLAKQKLEIMLNTPIKMLWADEKAPGSKYGHPADFYSSLSTEEKKGFSKVMCDRIFYNWKSDKFYEFFDIYDDVENLKPKYIARTKQMDTSQAPPNPSDLVTFNTRGNSTLTPPMLANVVKTPKTYKDPTAVLTLANLFQVSGYNPYTDAYTNSIETNPTEPGM
jgi:tetratricopeptide (TPR) repeat protein